MAPEVLIVGDSTQRSELVARMQRLGYAAALCSVAALHERVEQGAVPAAVVVCTQDVEPRPLMTSLRSTRRGCGVPVALHGPVGGKIEDLADLLDLGADHFLEYPANDEQLAAALEQLAGPGQPRPPSDAAAHDDDPESSRVVLDQLHRTLDQLEARLSDRAHEGDGDDIDLASLGLSALPEVDEQPGGGSMEPLGGSSLELSRVAAAPEPGRRVRTERLASDDAALSAEPSVAASGRADPARSSAVRVGSRRPSATRSGTGPRPGARPLPIDARGSLATLPVPRLLWVLRKARFHGAVRLCQGRVEKRLWWRDGALSFAESNVGHDRLVDGLLRRGLLLRGQYDAARQLTDAQPHRAAARLLQSGMLKKSEAPRVLRRHLASVIDSTFGWEQGEYHLHPGEQSEGRGLEAMPVERVIARGVRQRLSPAQLQAFIGDLDGRPRFLGDTGEARELADTMEMSPSELAWVGRLDGRRSVRELLEQGGTDEHELLALVVLLQTTGYLELVRAGTGSVPGADPAAIDRSRILERLARSREGDYFAILGLRADASRVDVRRAHTELHLSFSDDAIEASVRQALQQPLCELRDLFDEAHDVLSDETLRNAYLAHREEP